jgi:hypothetical protein
VLLPQHLSPPEDVIAQLEVLPVVIEPLAVCSTSPTARTNDEFEVTKNAPTNKTDMTNEARRGFVTEGMATPEDLMWGNVTRKCNQTLQINSRRLSHLAII